MNKHDVAFVCVGNPVAALSFLRPIGLKLKV